MDAFLLRVFFGDLMAPDALRAHVDQHRLDAEERLAEYQEIERRIKDQPQDRFGYMTLRWGLEGARGRSALGGAGARGAGRVRRVAAAALVAVFALPGGGVASPARGSALEARKPLRFTHTCVTRVERKRVVRFAAADGTRLIGVTFGAGARGVVLAHQGGGAPEGLCAWVPYARRLAAAGFRILAFDHRRYGDSESPRRERNVTRVDLDALAAVREFRRRGVTSVLLAGASLGGSAVVAAGAAARPSVQGVVSLSAPRLFGRVNTLAAARRLTMPVLYVAAVDDEPFATDAQTLFAATASADKRVEIFPGSDHGAPMLRDPAVRQLVDGWIAAHLTQ